MGLLWLLACPSPPPWLSLPRARYRRFSCFDARRRMAMRIIAPDLRLFFTVEELVKLLLNWISILRIAGCRITT